MTIQRKVYPVRISDGEWHIIEGLRDDEIELLERPVNPKAGGANKVVWIAQTELRKAKRETRITDGCLIRLEDWSHFGDMEGGLQTRIAALASAARRVGLLPPVPTPLLDL